MPPDFGKRGPWGPRVPEIGIDQDDACGCFESAVQALKSTACKQDQTEDLLNSSGWVRAETEMLLERIFITRLVHNVTDDRRANPYIPRRSYDEEKELYLRYAPKALGLKSYCHPVCPEACVQIFTLGTGYSYTRVVAIFFDQFAKDLAISAMQAADIKARFLNPDPNQSTMYCAEWGGRRISASKVEHGRDATDLLFKARIDDPYIDLLGHSRNQFYPVYAEMSTEVRSI